MKEFVILLCALTLLACNRNVALPRQPAEVAVASSVRFAKKDGVDLGRYSLFSVTRLSYGYQGVVDQSQTSPHIEQVRAVLNDKKSYWEACYGPTSDEVLGATYCYYLDEKTFSLLTTYRTK